MQKISSNNNVMYRQNSRSDVKIRSQLFADEDSLADTMRSVSVKDDAINFSNGKRSGLRIRNGQNGQLYPKENDGMSLFLSGQNISNEYASNQVHRISMKYRLPQSPLKPQHMHFGYQTDFGLDTPGMLNDNADYNSYVDNRYYRSKLSSGNEYSRSHVSDDVPKMMMSVQDVNSTRSVGGSSTRKNRMVEMTTINEDGTKPLAMVVLSDPTSGPNSRATRIVKLPSNPGAPKNSRASAKQPEPIFSRKVFVGGLPIDVTEEEVWFSFASFGKVLVDWPRRPEHSRGDIYEDCPRKGSRSVSGYVFLVFEQEESVQRLVNHCVEQDGRYYLFISSPTMSDKAVQVRPWRLSDIDYFSNKDALIDPRRTVFIGGVPRPTKARDLAECLESYYGKVSYVGIDIDPELKYPKGAARVTFATSAFFVAAISGRFVHVNHTENNKRVEIKPYVMEEQICDECEGQLCRFSYAPYFCGDPSCLQYYCEECWDRVHYVCSKTRSQHRIMVRTGDQTRVLLRPPHHNTTVPSFNHRRSYGMNLTNSNSSSSRLPSFGNRLLQSSGAQAHCNALSYGKTLTY